MINTINILIPGICFPPVYLIHLAVIADSGFKRSYEVTGSGRIKKIPAILVFYKNDQLRSTTFAGNYFVIIFT